MSATIYWLILPLDDHALVFRVADSEVLTFSAETNENISLSQAVIKVFQEQEYASQPVMLAVRSVDVLPVSLPADSSANRQTVIYELEEYVPIPAEQFTADYFSRTVGRFAGVLAHHKILPLLDELAAEQIFVQSLVPLSVLVAQYLAGTIETNGNPKCFIWRFGIEPLANRIEIFFLNSDGEPLSWCLSDISPEPLRQTLDSMLLRLDGVFDVITLNLSEEMQSVLSGNSRLQQTVIEPEPHIIQNAIVHQSGQILTRKQKPWLDFCRDTLAMRGTDKIFGKSVRTFLWGGIAFLSALSIVFLIRGFQYRSMESQFRREQEMVFREALPEHKLHTGFRDRLESEYKKISAQRENTADLPQRESVLIPLLNVLKSLPPKVRYRFPEIRIEENNIRLDGQLQVHGDAEVIATALENGGFAVETPGTQQTGGSGVSVRLSVMRRSAEVKR